MMIDYKNIRDVHLELSTLCNASCPKCPRNFNGYPHNSGYPELNLTLENTQTIFSPDFIKQLTSLRINGNYGDIVMNPQAIDIIRYFRNANTNLTISISTNGSARNNEFWKNLAELKTRVFFCLDGLEDTHKLYRQNTSWTTIIKNAKTFIDAGGYAVWKFIIFDHNKHQLEECRQLSKQLNFKFFQLVDDGRNNGPVFNKHGDFTHALGNYQGPTNFIKLYSKSKKDVVLIEDILHGREPKNKVTCKAKTSNSIYVTANGEVYPCCFTGFFPRTFGENYHQAANSQIIPLLEHNNATERPLEDCINWFSNIENSWNIPKYEQGRLVICDDVCGSN